jgi:inorganic triphosphatase YgiF
LGVTPSQRPYAEQGIATIAVVTEIELKLGLPDGAAAAVDRALRRRRAKALDITSIYWDSADRRLARAGLSLRLRRSGAGWEQTLKGEGASPVERLEETVPRPGDWGDGGPPAEPWHHAGTAAGTLLDAALSRRGGRAPALGPVFASVVRRLAVHVVIPGADVEVAFDRGALHAGGRALALCEVELELKHGDAAGLITLGRASVDAHGMWLSTIAKSARGERLAAGDRVPAVKARPARFDAAANGPAIFRAVVRSCLDQVLANASVIAAGDADDEAVHQLRVGLRRLRTAWRELGAWRGALGPAWEAPATEVFRALGAYRDRRIVAASLRRRLAEAGSPEPALPAPATAEVIDPVAVVRGKAFQHALLDLTAYLLGAAPDAPENGAASDDKRAREARPADVIGRRLARLHARLRHDAKRFESLAGLERHRVRKRLKRLRYLSELVAPLHKRGRVDRFLDALAPAQDELGRYMDLVVATRLATARVESGDAAAWFNVGWLQAQLPRAVERCDRALRRVGAAEPFWPGASPRRR